MNKKEKTKLTNQFGGSITWITGIFMIIFFILSRKLELIGVLELIFGFLLISVGSWYSGLWSD